MRIEEMALRSEIRQMLNEAGFNRETIKQLVKESIDDIVRNQINQALKERPEQNVEEAVSKYLDGRISNTIRSTAADVIREKLRWMNFRVEVNIKEGEK